MTKWKRNGAWGWAFLLHRKYVKWIKSVGLDKGLEMGQLVQFALGLALVKLIVPNGHQAPDIVQRSVHIPAYSIQLVRQDYHQNSSLEISNGSVGVINLVWLYGHDCLTSRGQERERRSVLHTWVQRSYRSCSQIPSSSSPRTIISIPAQPID